MTSLSRSNVSPSTKLLLRILERPGLVAAVRELPGAVLGKLIDRIGLEDAGELVALATTAQLERVFDDDLWRADRAGGDETFRPERFALWLRVMLEAGEELLVQRLCELPQDLRGAGGPSAGAGAGHGRARGAVEPGDEEAEALERALETSVVEEWEEFRLIARDPDVWDDVWNALVSLDRDHHDRLRAILEQCCAMSTEYISGQGGLFQVLTADEMLDSDVAAARDDRRVAEGFISPADARAFLELARRGRRRRCARSDHPRVFSRAGNRRSKHDRGSAEWRARRRTRRRLATRPTWGAGGAAAGGGGDRAAAGAAAGGAAGPTDEAADSKRAQAHLVAPLFEQAMSDLRQRDPERFSARVRELGYLVNVWIAGGAHEGRRPRPVEALEMVLEDVRGGDADAARGRAGDAGAGARGAGADAG